MVMLPSLTSQLKLSYGWRPTLMAVGAAQAVLGVVAASFLLRRPEDFGLWPDGAAEAEAEAGLSRLSRLSRLGGLSSSSSVELASVQRREAGVEVAGQEETEHSCGGGASVAATAGHGSGARSGARSGASCGSVGESALAGRGSATCKL